MGSGTSGKGSSSARSTSQSSTTNTQTTVNQVDNRVFGEGTQYIEGDGNYIISTDHNAIGAASDLARRSVEVADSIGRSGMDLSIRTTQTVTDFARDALRENGNLASGALSFGEQALGSVQDAYEDANNSTESLFDKALGYIGSLTDKSQASLGKTVEALNAISVEQNKSTDQRVAEISQNAIKYTLIAVGVLTLGLIGYAATRK